MTKKAGLTHPSNQRAFFKSMPIGRVRQPRFLRIFSYSGKLLDGHVVCALSCVNALYFMSHSLFAPLQVGALLLPNRVIMAPLTRCRADAGRVPSAEAVEYYGQRAAAGFILSEATSVMPMGVGYPDTPGIWSSEQVEGWKRVTERVHAQGGRILLQLWHVGRVSDPMYLDGEQPVAPSAIAANGHVSLVRPKKPYEVPRALETDEIPAIIAAYKRGAQNAKDAGFDGVEVHGANGYLIEQFLIASSNTRTDRYGGSLENRARFALEVADAVLEVWDADRVGYHLSPKADVVGAGDEDLLETYGYLARELGQRNLAFIFCRESREEPYLTPHLKTAFGGITIANQGGDKAEAEQLVESEKADAFGWGQLFIANPDLPLRLETDAPLNEPNSATYYEYPSGDKAEGYTDYPSLEVAASR